MKNLYVIGDVHGCYYTLLKLISLLPINSRIIFVGDLVDRGLFSKDVIEYVLNSKYECILGNHDLMMIENGLSSFDGNDNENIWLDLEIGGDKTVKSYKGDKNTFIKHIEYLSSLPSYVVIDEIIITHGLGEAFYKESDKTLIRNEILYKKNGKFFRFKDWERSCKTSHLFNIFGHSHYKAAKFGINYCGIDTGACYGNSLSAINLRTKELISVHTDKRDIDEN